MIDYFLKAGLPEVKSKSIYFPEIGEVLFRKTRLNKKINITIKPPGIVKVSLPEKVAFGQAEKFLKDNINWAAENLEKVKKTKKNREIIDDTTNYKTRSHTLYFKTHKSKKVKYTLQGKNITVCYPETADIKEEFVQKAVRKCIDEALKIEAQDYLPARAELLSGTTGLIYKQVKLFKSKRFWGMCMNDNTIKLNIHLMRLPDELIDYVIFHELAHIKEKNHSRKFYEVLKNLVPEHKSCYDLMKKYYPARYK